MRALRFDDLSGAYGAYTFYRGIGWPREEIGTGAASDNNRVLFWRGNIMVDATLLPCRPHVRLGTARTGQPASRAARAPGAARRPFWPFCHRIRSIKQTTHYALGPAGYAGSGGVLPPDLVGFDRGAEAVTANYSLRPARPRSPSSTTPRRRWPQRMEPRSATTFKAGSKAQPALPKPLADSDQASLEVRRSGPLVAIVSGDAIPDESHKLLESVHYEADLVSIPQPDESEVAKTGQLLLGIADLVMIGSAAAILLGFFLGGGRALYRMARGKPISSVYEAEFISSI